MYKTWTISWTRHPTPARLPGRLGTWLIPWRRRPPWSRSPRPWSPCVTCPGPASCSPPPAGGKLLPCAVGHLPFGQDLGAIDS